MANTYPIVRSQALVMERGAPFGLARDAHGEQRARAWQAAIPRSFQRLVQQLSPGRRSIDPLALRFATMRNEEIWDLIKRDAVFMKAIQQRLAEIAAAEWYLDPGDDKDSRALVPYIRSMIKEIPDLPQALHNLAACIFEGASWLRMFSRERKRALMPDNVERTWWGISWLKHVPATGIRRDWDEAIHADPETGERIDTRDWYWSTLDSQSRTWLRVRHEDEWQYVMCHCGDDAFTAGMGSGLLSSLFFYWYYKTQAMKHLLQGMERFGQPWIVAKIKAGSHVATSAGSQFLTPEAKRALLLAELERMRQSNILLLDHDDTVEPLDFSGENVVGYMQMISYFDDAAVSCILGSLLPSGQAADTGSLARAEVERVSTNNLLRFDRAVIEGGMQAVPRALCMMNRRNLMQIRAPSGKFLSAVDPPSWRLRDIQSGLNQENVRFLLDAGCAVLRSEIYKAAGNATIPDADDDVVQPPGAGGGAKGVPGAGGAAVDVFGQPTPGANDAVASDGVTMAAAAPAAVAFRSPLRAKVMPLSGRAS